MVAATAAGCPSTAPTPRPARAWRTGRSWVSTTKTPARVGGSIEVLVGDDDDSDLVVRDVGASRCGRSAPGRPTRTSVRQPVADPAGRRRGQRGLLFDGAWTAWHTNPGEAEFTAGSKRLTLITPDGNVVYPGRCGPRPTTSGTGRASTWWPGAVHPRRGARRDGGGVAAAGPAVPDRRLSQLRRLAARPPVDVAYDMCDTTLCQVYGGASAEAPSDEQGRAVDGEAGADLPAEPDLRRGSRATAGRPSPAASRTSRRSGTASRGPPPTTTGGSGRSPQPRWRTSTTTTTST